MQWPASPDVGSHCIPFTIMYSVSYFLSVYVYSLLQLFKIYGFCEDEERP